MDAVRTYGPETAVLTVTGRQARIVVAGAVDALDVGEEIGARAVVNRTVAGLPQAVGLVAVAVPGVTWGSGALEALVRTATERPRTGLLGPMLRDPSGAALASAGPATPPRGRRWPRRTRPATAAQPVAAGVTGWLDGTCVLLRRTAWDSVDGYDTRIADPHGVDVDLGARLAAAGWLVVGVPEAEVMVHP